MKNIVIGILAHVDAGKTTLSEAMLYQTGAIRNLGRVDHKNAFLDTDIQERDRGITIFSKQAEMTYKDTKLMLLDTPGHVDFSAEMERTLQVLDYAVLVISGREGVQGHTVTLWKLLQKYEIPVFLFINKMDLEGADRAQILEELQSSLSAGCLDFEDPEEEQAAMCEEGLLEEYLETDKSFKAGYIMIKNLPAKGLYISELPGKKENSSTYLKSGQILWASKKGTYKDKTYYHLKNGMYLYASEKYMEELASYEKLEGYVAITYISSTGVRLRKWADFQADNVVKSVYVGDKVQVKGKVTRKNGESAYITDKGLYLTTDIQYLNDYTTEADSLENEK
mgnify:CR=1 FL=1